MMALSGCATLKSEVNQATKPDNGPLYSDRADMQFALSTGQTIDGVGVAKLPSGPVAVKLVSLFKMDRLQVTTCARQDVYNGEKKEFTYDYYPTPAEINGVCPMYFEAYSKKQLTSWGFLAFRTDETIPSQMYCNGQSRQFSGLAVCQTKSGLEQTLNYSVKIDFAEAEPGCNMTTTDNKSFTFKPAKGFCRATFMAKDSKGQPQWARAIVLGYASVLIRE